MCFENFIQTSLTFDAIDVKPDVTHLEAPRDSFQQVIYY